MGQDSATTGSNRTLARATTIRLDQLDSFLAKPENYWGDSRAWARDSASGLEDTPQRDPRNTGYRGAYPQVGRNGPSLETVRLMYDTIGLAGTIVDLVAEETWGEWFDVETSNENLKKALENLFRRPTPDPEGVPLWVVYELADKAARRDGRSLVYYNLRDRSGGQEKEPAGVEAIQTIRIVLTDEIVKAVVDVDRDSINGGRVIAWIIKGPNGSQVTVHADRVQPFIPLPKETDPTDGKSELMRPFGDIHADENVKWAAAESVVQRVSPLIAVKQVGEGEIDDVKKAAIQKGVQNIQDATSNRIFLDGIEIHVIDWNRGTLNPQSYHELYIQGAATSARIPKRVITGDEAGALASSAEDSQRFNARISRRQEGYADPKVRGFIDRVQRWGLAPAGDIELRWNPLNEPTQAQKGAAEQSLASARVTYINAGAPLPASIEYDATKRPDLLKLSESAPVPPGLRPNAETPDEDDEEADDEEDEEQEDEERPAGADAQMRAPKPAPGLAPLVRRGTPRILQALLALEDAFLKLFQKRTGQDRRWFRRTGRDAADDTIGPDDPLVDANAKTDAARKELEKAIYQLLLDSAQSGGAVAWEQVGQEGLFEFIDDTETRVFKTVAATTSQGIAEEVTAKIRRSIAEGMSRGETIAELQDRVLEEFEATPARALTIAQTESARGYNHGSVMAMEQADVEECTVQVLPGAGPECRDLEGRRVNVSEARKVLPVHPGCRCTFIPIVPEVTA